MLNQSMTTFAARRCVVMTGAPWNAPAAQKAVASRKNRATMSRASATQIEVGKCLELSEGRSQRKRARPQRVQPWPAPPRGCCIAPQDRVEPLLLEAARFRAWRSARAQASALLACVLFRGGRPTLPANNRPWRSVCSACSPRASPAPRASPLRCRAPPSSRVPRRSIVSRTAYRSPDP